MNQAGFPIKVCNETAAILEFFSADEVAPDKTFLMTICGVGEQVVRVIECIRSREQLARNQQEQVDLFKNASVGMHFVGPDGTILQANKAELDFLGYSHDEYIGHSITEFHADQNVIEDILRRLQADETLNNYKARLRCKDGSIKHVFINSNVYRKDGQFVHTRCFTQDVTGQVQAVQELQDSEAASVRS